MGIACANRGVPVEPFNTPYKTWFVCFVFFVVKIFSFYMGLLAKPNPSDASFSGSG
jgi:hypothetical protein